MRDILGDDWDKIVVKNVSYETTDATIDSQIAELQGAGANALLVAAAFPSSRRSRSARCTT